MFKGGGVSRCSMFDEKINGLSSTTLSVGSTGVEGCYEPGIHVSREGPGVVSPVQDEGSNRLGLMAIGNFIIPIRVLTFLHLTFFSCKTRITARKVAEEMKYPWSIWSI